MLSFYFYPVPRSVVGTFLCGPEALGKVLEKKCAKFSDVDPRKTKFYFNKENFWRRKAINGLITRLLSGLFYFFRLPRNNGKVGWCLQTTGYTLKVILPMRKFGFNVWLYFFASINTKQKAGFSMLPSIYGQSQICYQWVQFSEGNSTCLWPEASCQHQEVFDTYRDCTGFVYFTALDWKYTSGTQLL